MHFWSWLNETGRGIYGPISALCIGDVYGLRCDEVMEIKEGRLTLEDDADTIPGCFLKFVKCPMTTE